MAKKPKPPPLPNPRTAQQPGQTFSGTELVKMLTGRGVGPVSLLAPTPMAVPPRGKKGKGK